MIGEAHDLLRTTNLPEERSQRAYELLTASMHLADALLEESPLLRLARRAGRKPRSAAPSTSARSPHGARHALVGAPKKTPPSNNPALGLWKSRPKSDGRPDPRHISTTYVERQNLTIRMAIRRFTRLTNAFSKKLDNHKAACALHFAYYNFCRIHKSLRVTPAMESGLTGHIWSLRELLA